MIYNSAQKILNPKTNENSESEWYNLIRNIIEGKPIELTITFPTTDISLERLKYLYEELQKIGINEEVFELSYLRVFDFYKKNSNYITQLYYCIIFLQEISFSKYYRRLIDIIYHKELIHLSYSKINLHYLLLNILMENDVNNELRDYFFSELSSCQDTALYQTILRYSCDYLPESDFNAILSEIMFKLNEEQLDPLIKMFDELAYFHKSKLLSDWILDISGKEYVNPKYFDLLLKKILEWLNKINKNKVNYFDINCGKLRQYLQVKLKEKPENSELYIEI